VKYAIRLEHDGSGDAPQVIIHEEHGPDVMEVYENPVIVPGDWDHWAAGPLARRVLGLLNGEPEESMTTTGALAQTCGARRLPVDHE